MGDRGVPIDQERTAIERGRGRPPRGRVTCRHRVRCGVQLHLHDNPALTVAIALAAGIVGQSLAQHLRLPGIVLLLVLGAVLGPDVANVVQPESLGSGLSGIVGFAVAVILFEGGLGLEWRRIRREGRAIRQLITFGALVSLSAGAVVAALVLGWEWQRSLLFGTLVVVTGPTVVTPLLRRMRANKTVSTVLEAEGVLGDAIGAITAAVALELVLRPSGEGWALATPMIAGRLLFGGVCGLVIGLLLAALLRYRNVIPEGLENVFALAFAVVAFQLPNAIVHESGLPAVIVAGMVVGNSGTHVRAELAEFKEQLTVLFVGMLFVLLVADVRLGDVMALGWRGAAVAACCIALVRPLSVMLGTLGTELTRRERVFIGWIGPRGIVAAAVASLFGYELEAAGIAGGDELRSLVFLVIAVTVFWSALTGPIAARVLGLRRKSGAGWLIVGANPLARRVADALDPVGVESLLVDNDPQNVLAAEADGLRAIQGNALEPAIAIKAELDTRYGAICLTANEDMNYLFAQKSRRAVRTIRYAVAITAWTRGVTPDMVDELGAEVLFGGLANVALWSQRLDHGTARIERWRFRGSRKAPSIFTGEETNPRYLPLVHRRKSTLEPVTMSTRFRKGSEVLFIVDLDSLDAAQRALASAGWEHLGIVKARRALEEAPPDPAVAESEPA